MQKLNWNQKSITRNGKGSQKQAHLKYPNKYLFVAPWDVLVPAAALFSCAAFAPFLSFRTPPAPCDLTFTGRCFLSKLKQLHTRVRKRITISKELKKRRTV